MRRRGFTIIELLAVIGILSVLMTIVTTAAVGALRDSRKNRTEAMRVALQAAIVSFRAADSGGKWPGALANMNISCWLPDESAQNVFRIVVQRSTGESGQILPLIDPSALFVAPTGAKDGTTVGMTFNEARQGTEKRQKIGIARMLFGYPDASTGRFRRFYLYYNAAADTVTVSTSRTMKDTPDSLL